MAVVIAYITTKDKKEAREIGRLLITEKIAACVNILDGMESMYFWEGKLETSNECVLIAKTVEAHVDKLISCVKENHSYSVPCIITLPVKSGNPDYLKWLAESVSPPIK